MEIQISWLKPLVPIARRVKKVVMVEIDADQAEVAERIVPDIEIRGVRFWFLLSACVIASIGLNTNSVAVIIGAMLVSPLMGPILGLGFGLATRNRETVSLAARNLSWAVGGSLVLSTLYFLISPLDEATPEILARTAPTLLDLFVAVASAFAGVIAFTARGGVTIVPGVAIATAIMPPLCTAGFGIASGRPLIALGAFYLFAVNAFAITVVAFFLFKRMHFRETEEEVRQNKTLSTTIVSVVLVVFLAPLCWTLFKLWRDSSVRREVRTLTREVQEDLELVNWQYESGDQPRLILYAFRQVPEQKKEALLTRLHEIQPQATLLIRQASESDETKEFVNRFKTSPLLPVLSDAAFLNNVNKLADKLNNQPEPVKTPDFLALGRELRPWLEASESPTFLLEPAEEGQTEPVLLIEHAKAVSKAHRTRTEERLRSWYAERVPGAKPLKILWQRNK